MRDASSASDAAGDAYRGPTIDAWAQMRSPWAMRGTGPTCFEPETGRASSRLTIAERRSCWCGCSTAVVRVRSDQLVEEINCLAPVVPMARIDGIAGLTLGSAALP